MAAGDANQSASPAVIALVDYHFGDIENGVAICHNLRSNKIDVLAFCSSLVLSLQMNFAKESLKTYDARIHYIRKNS